MQKIKLCLRIIALFLLWGVLLPRYVKAQTGSPDLDFGGGDGWASTYFLSDGHSSCVAAVVQTNGKSVLAGSTWIPNVDFTSQIAVARFNLDGSLDPGFGTYGKATASLAGADIYASDVVMLPDGKILCAGGGESATEIFFLLARFNADGTPDNTFGGGDGIVTTHVAGVSQGATAVALQSDGKIVVAGYVDFDFCVLRFKPDGTLDNTFGGGDGFVTTHLGDDYASAKDVLIQPDGKIVTAGYAKFNGYEDFVVLRYSANGTLDNSFSGDGIATASFTDKNDRAKALALQSDGKIILAGYTGTIGTPSNGEIGVVRFTVTGTVDASFGGGLNIIHVTDKADGANAITVQPDGKILLAGYSQHSDAPLNELFYHFTLVRLTINGLPDPTFGEGDGITVLPVNSYGDFAYAAAFQPDGKLIVAGYGRFGDFNKFIVSRFITGLTVDTTAPSGFYDNVSLYPNPVSSYATLEYELSGKNEVAVNLYDAQGRFIKNMAPFTEKSAGKHEETLLLDADLPSGNYLLSLETESGRVVLKVIH